VLTSRSSLNQTWASNSTWKQRRTRIRSWPTSLRDLEVCQQ